MGKPRGRDDKEANSEASRWIALGGAGLMQFIWFLGRFHVLLLHLPLGILSLAVALEIRSEERRVGKECVP